MRSTHERIWGWAFAPALLLGSAADAATLRVGSDVRRVEAGARIDAGDGNALIDEALAAVAAGDRGTSWRVTETAEVGIRDYAEATGTVRQASGWLVDGDGSRGPAGLYARGAAEARATIFDPAATASSGARSAPTRLGLRIQELEVGERLVFELAGEVSGDGPGASSFVRLLGPGGELFRFSAGSFRETFELAADHGGPLVLTLEADATAEVTGTTVNVEATNSAAFAATLRLVPEPAGLLLVAAGGLAVFGRRRR